MPDRQIHTCRLLAIGSELTIGATQDTNSAELARDLTERGIVVEAMLALPDRLGPVRDAIAEATGTADLVVTTGGLGPTPDDLTREAIAAACGLEPSVDRNLETWLRGLFERRGLPMAEANLKQAWLIPGAIALSNPNGTAPGWWVDRADGGVIVALPGPPREMRPIWRDEVIPRLEARGAGGERASETWRLTGVGESALAALIGEERLRAADPEIATYARPDAVDVRVGSLGPGAADRVAAALADLEGLVGEFRFARGDETWVDALGDRLAGRTLAVVEIGTGGQIAALLGVAPWLIHGELVAPGSRPAAAHPSATAKGDLRRHAARIREAAGTDVGLAVRARERAGDTAVTVAVAMPGSATQVTRTAFLGGDEGRRRAALVACAELWKRLGERSA